MIKHIATLASLTVLFVSANAQSLSEADILRAVETHSPALKSSAAAAQALRAEARTGNSLPDPEVGYVYQWGSSGASGQDEFTASQGFDFPTAYLQRRKIAQAKIESADASLRGERIGQLLQARLLVQEMIFLQKRLSTDSLRLSDAQYARKIAERRAEAGDITAIEENKIRFQILSAQNNLTRTRMALSTAAASLSSMAGFTIAQTALLAPLPLPALGTLDQTLEKAYADDPGLSGSQTEGKTALAQRKLATSLALPKFNAGYKYSSADGLKFSGVTVGMTLPIFESRNTVKLARARIAETGASYQAQRNALTTELTAKYDQAKNLESMYGFYRENGNAMEKSSLLKKALEAGRMTILEYFTELDAVYQNMDESAELAYDYNCLAIELDKYSL